MALRILLVEDHDDTAAVTARLLRKCGHTVTIAQTYDAAVNVGGMGFDLLLADIGLPGKSGIDVFHELRRHATFKSIALTAFGMPEDVKRCIDAGFDTHLLKPIDFSKLEETIDRLSGRTTPLPQEVDERGADRGV